MAKMPDPRNHLIWSLAKSGLRIVFCVLGVAFDSLWLMGAGLIGAELFGIFEELA